jgi:cell division protein FtsZ
VNAASTLIQNAAHEDANIIFGAVLDESMGDHVKITVIATGFRQDHFGRRNRISGEVQVPRVSVQERPAVPRFASEEMIEEELPPVFESRKPVPVEKHVLSEPAPFFLQPEPILIEEVPPPHRQDPPARTPIVHSAFDEPLEEEYARLIPSKPAPAVQEANRAESETHLDHLDIPAFLRRSN